MQRQVLTQKSTGFIFALMLSICSLQSLSYANPEFIEGESAIREIAENAEVGTNIGEPLRYSIGKIDFWVSISLRGPDAQAFDVVHVHQSAQLKTKSTLDYETKDTYEVRVIASSLWSRDTITVTINVTDVNEEPVFSQEMDSVSVNRVHRVISENTPGSSNNPDGPQVALTYNLSGLNADMFEIDSGTDQLLTKMSLDYESSSIDVLGGSAPPVNVDAIDFLLDPVMPQTLDRDTLQVRLQELRAESDGSLRFLRAIAMLENVLASIPPDKTVLLSNYPNPFNPETWIPYHLSKSSDVQITIYDAYGTVVRHLEMGHQSEGYYTSRSQSAYWDGRNDFGERAASGVYFYQLQADTISPMKKMVILK